MRDFDTRHVLKAITVVGECLMRELRGEACLDLEEVAATRKGCAVTQSFSAWVEDRATLEQAVAAHAIRLGEKLRREGLGTDAIVLKPFRNGELERKGAATLTGLSAPGLRLVSDRGRSA